MIKASMHAQRLRIVVVHPFWGFWVHTTAPSLREDRLALARRIAESLASDFEVGGVADFDSVEEGSATGRRLGASAPDVILVLQTMAVPSAYTLGFLDELADVPVVIWALHEQGLVGDDFDHGSITAEGATVGAPMLVNILSRRRRPFELVLGRLTDDEVRQRLERALRQAAIASRLRRSRIARVGRSQEGYLHVDVDDGELSAAMGMTVVRLEPAEFAERYAQVADARVRELEGELRSGWRAEGEIPTDSLARSLRAAVALEDLSDAHSIDGGAFNCHVPQIRFGEQIGITPCWGLGRETSRGRPWTCTGDILTAVAMQTTKRLGGAALYHEFEAIDYATGEVVIANSGEHDLAWLAAGEQPRVRLNGWFCGRDPRCGICAVFEPPAGPATVVGFTPHPDARGGFRYVVARGELTKRRFPHTGTVNGSFRFASGPVEEAWARWASAGVNHHSSATPGDLADDIVAVARHLGIEAVLV